MNSGTIGTCMYRLQTSYTIHRIILQLIVARQLYGSEPVKPLDLRFYTRAMQAAEVYSDYVSQLQDAMLRKFGENKRRLRFLPAIQKLLRSKC